MTCIKKVKLWCWSCSWMKWWLSLLPTVANAVQSLCSRGRHDRGRTWDRWKHLIIRKRIIWFYLLLLIKFSFLSVVLSSKNELLADKYFAGSLKTSLKILSSVKHNEQTQPKLLTASEVGNKVHFLPLWTLRQSVMITPFAPLHLPFDFIPSRTFCISDLL